MINIHMCIFKHSNGPRAVGYFVILDVPSLAALLVTLVGDLFLRQSFWVSFWLWSTQLRTIGIAYGLKATHLVWF